MGIFAFLNCSHVDRKTLQIFVSRFQKPKSGLAWRHRWLRELAILTADVRLVLASMLGGSQWFSSR